MAGRKYDIILWGSTGFTGQLTAKYLAKEYGKELKIAIAGRNFEKLNAIKRDFNLGFDVIVADIGDSKSLEEMTSSTSCLISTAGPFARVGEPIVDACVKSKTNYVDITGEPQFVRRVIDRHHEEAKQSSIKIVPCCGFDCTPSDLGCEMIVDHLLSKGLKPQEVRLLVDECKGGASGGTIASVINLIESSPTSKLLEVANPFCLAPRDPQTNLPLQAEDKAIVAAASDNMVAGWDSVTKKYTMPYVMQGIDTRVVNRSNAVKDWLYGRNFLYTERMIAPSLFVALVSMLVMPIASALIFFPWTRWIVKRFLPRPGEGPSKELQETGFFKMKFWGRGTNDKGESTIVMGGITALNGDPGYVQTAKLISEAAVCLVRDSETTPKTYGVLTPSTAFGPTLRERLNQKNITFFLE